MKRAIAMCLWLVMVLFMARASLAAENSAVIKSDSTWRVSTSLIEGWQNIAFDDSTWVNATSPAPRSCGWETIPLGDDNVSSIWSTNGDYGVYFRKSFFLQNIPVDSAVIYTVSDDDHEVYVNGVKVASDYNGSAGPTLTTDIKAYLQSGKNVIAIYGQDTVGGCQWLGVFAKIIFSGGSVGGSVTNTGLSNVICKNVTTGQSVTIKRLKGANSWDCAAAGLQTNKGDTIKETLTGTAN